MMEKYGSLHALARADEQELVNVEGVGESKAAALKSALALAVRLSQETVAQMPLMDTPEKIADMLREQMRGHLVETFYAVLLNTRQMLIKSILLSQGTLNMLLVHPRQVFFSAITYHAAFVVLAHNHPSGDPTPSDADIRITRDLIRAGQLMKIEVQDHIIIGDRTNERPKDYVSLREAGYFYA